MIKSNIFPPNRIHPFQLPLRSFLKCNDCYLDINSSIIYFANKLQLIYYQLQMFNPQKFSTVFFSFLLIMCY